MIRCSPQLPYMQPGLTEAWASHGTNSQPIGSKSGSVFSLYGLSLPSPSPSHFPRFGSPWHHLVPTGVCTATNTGAAIELPTETPEFPTGNGLPRKLIMRGHPPCSSSGASRWLQTSPWRHRSGIWLCGVTPRRNQRCWLHQVLGHVLPARPLVPWRGRDGIDTQLRTSSPQRRHCSSPLWPQRLPMMGVPSVDPDLHQTAQMPMGGSLRTRPVAF